MQRNKKLAHKIERSQTTTKRKGQKKYLKPRGENKTIAKGSGEKNENPPRWNRDWSWGSFNWMASKQENRGEVVLGNSSRFLDVLQNHLNYMWV